MVAFGDGLMIGKCSTFGCSFGNGSALYVGGCESAASIFAASLFTLEADGGEAISAVCAEFTRAGGGGGGAAAIGRRGG